MRPAHTATAVAAPVRQMHALAQGGGQHAFMFLHFKSPATGMKFDLMGHLFAGTGG